MDLETYEDSVLSEQMIGDDECFLVEGNSTIFFWSMETPFVWNYPLQSKPQWWKHPMRFVETLPESVLKPVTISTGMTIQVPLFIKKDDVIKLSTADRSYLGRV